jgi:hypothetical protein
MYARNPIEAMAAILNWDSRQERRELLGDLPLREFFPWLFLCWSRCHAGFPQA